MAPQQFSRLRKQAQSSQQLWRLGLAVTILLFLLGTLAACNPTQTPTSAGSSTRTVPVVQPSATAIPPTATPTIVPTATPDLGVFQVYFSDHYTAAACSGTYPTGTVCVTTTGSGQEAGLGNLSLSRTSIYAPGGSDSCGPATTQGTLGLATGETITFTGTGTFCRASQVANFSYTITGGTGQYVHATGKGTIYVPLPTSSSSGTEGWAGTLFT